MSIYDNIAYGCRIHGIRNRRKLNLIVEHYLCAAGLWEEVKDRLHTPAVRLSIGQQQRLCLARSLAVEPQFILADEATGNLDKENGRRAAAILYDISKAGTTVVLSTHNEELISEFPGVVYRCGEGRLQECTDAYTPLLAPDAIESKSIEENINENN